MPEFAYLLERFPSFGQTFVYREVAELERQGTKVHVYSIRRPMGEPRQDWDQQLVGGIHYLPEENAVVGEVDRLVRQGRVSDSARNSLGEWGRRTDFLRLYQAISIGVRLQEIEVRHVHAHFAGMAARTAFWINKFFGITFSFTGHANDIFAPGDFEIGLGTLMESAKAIITVSDYAADFLKEQFPDSAEKIHRVYNGLDLAQFKCADFSSATCSIVAVGRLIEKKGFADLIRTCEMLKDRGHEFHCGIIGDGPLEKELRAQIGELRLDKYVTLAGPQPQAEIISRLAAARVLVLPCITEKSGAKDNLPTVIMEAMAAGVPVVSTPVGGIPEMVLENETGFLVPSGNTTALADAIERVIVDPSRAKKLGQIAHDRAQTLFSIKKNVSQLRTFLL